MSAQPNSHVTGSVHLPNAELPRLATTSGRGKIVSLGRNPGHGAAAPDLVDGERDLTGKGTQHDGPTFG